MYQQVDSDRRFQKLQSNFAFGQFDSSFTFCGAVYVDIDVFCLVADILT